MTSHRHYRHLRNLSQRSPEETARLISTLFAGNEQALPEVDRRLMTCARSLHRHQRMASLREQALKQVQRALNYLPRLCSTGAGLLNSGQPSFSHHRGALKSRKSLLLSTKSPFRAKNNTS